MPIISNPVERIARASEKRRSLLRFLRDEVYTTPAVAALLMGCGERAARQTVASLEADGLVKRHEVKLMPDLPPVVLIGITDHGQGMAFDVDKGEEPSARTFEPGKYNLVYLSHALDIQRLRIYAERSGIVKRWLPGEMLGAGKKGAKRPDAVILTTSGKRVAVEVERSIKNRKRYLSVLQGHLEAIAPGKWNKAVWACPSAEIAARVEALVKSARRIQINGIDTALTDKHFQNLSFVVYESFVSYLESVNTNH